MMTTWGIELDLKQSNYKFSIYGIDFYFSSRFYLEKFKNNVKNYVFEENAKLKAKYKLNSDFTIFLSIAFYKKIEKRGFYIKNTHTGRKFENSEKIQFEI